MGEVAERVLNLGNRRLSIRATKVSSVPDPTPFPGVYADAGLFVCFEGGEGAGKSTQSRLLARHLREQGHEVVLTFEPGDTAVGQQIRRILLDPATGELDHRAEALLYAADKAEHLRRVVRPALARGAVVITDRYVDSTLAYQGGGREIDPAELEQLARWATADLRPHLTILLDLAPGQGMARFRGRDRIEAESVEFHKRVRTEFSRLASENPGHYLVLDARGPIEQIQHSIRDRLDAVLPAPAASPIADGGNHR